MSSEADAAAATVALFDSLYVANISTAHHAQRFLTLLNAEQLCGIIL